VVVVLSNKRELGEWMKKWIEKEGEKRGKGVVRRGIITRCKLKHQSLLLLQV